MLETGEAGDHRRHREDVEVEEERRRARGHLRDLRRRRRAPVRDVRFARPSATCSGPTAGIKGAWRFVNRVWTEFDSQPAETPAPRRRGRRPRPRACVRATHRLVKAADRGDRGLPLQQRHRPPVRIPRRAEGRAGRGRRPGAAGRPPRGPERARPGWSRPSPRTWPRKCWSRIGGAGLVAQAPWPSYDPALAADDEVVLPVQINGKRRGEIRVAARARRGRGREDRAGGRWRSAPP